MPVLEICYCRLRGTVYIRRDFPPAGARRRTLIPSSMPASRISHVLAGIALWLAAAIPGWGQQSAMTPYYNVKAGPVYLTLSSGFSAEYTDNVNLTNGTTSPKVSELILYPHFGVDIISRMQLRALNDENQNTFSMRANFGYRDYVFHPELSRNENNLQIAPDSEFALVIRSGHVRLRLRDRFGLESDPPADGSLSNVAVFRRFTNDFGADTHWDMNSTTSFDLNYSRRNTYALDIVALGSSGTATNLDTSNYTSVSNTLTFMGQTKALSPWLSIGGRATVSDMEYPGASDQNSTSWSYGPFANLKLSDYTNLSAACGITQTHSGASFPDPYGEVVPGSEQTTEYADLTLFNRLNTYYDQTISIGRQTSWSVIGSQLNTDYIRYQSNWKTNSKISIRFGLFAENTTDLGTAGPGGHYRLYGASVGTGYALSRKLSTSLSYRYTDKACDNPEESYQQNTITWTLDYRF